MPKVPASILFLLVATAFETNGDALVRKAMFDHAGFSPIRCGLMAAGAALLFGYALLLNAAPLPFGRVVGLYIAVLFVVWQGTAYVQFRSVPDVAVLVGGGMIVMGGLVVSFLGRNEVGH